MRRSSARCGAVCRRLRFLGGKTVSTSNRISNTPVWVSSNSTHFLDPRTTYGSHSQLRSLFSDGNLTTSVVRFQPRAEDNGQSLVCRAENPRMSVLGVREDQWDLNVYCEFFRRSPRINRFTLSPGASFERKKATKLLMLMISNNLSRIFYFGRSKIIRYWERSVEISKFSTKVCSKKLRKSADGWETTFPWTLSVRVSSSSKRCFEPWLYKRCTILALGKKEVLLLENG